MVKVVQSYMNEEITAFQFDEALDEAVNATEDKTVWTVRQELWFHYDDCKDHRIVASKEQWDHFNRLLLVLESDGEMEIVRTWHTWHPRQVVATVLFITFMVVAVQSGFGEHLVVLALPFGPFSMLLAWLKSRHRKRTTPAAETALAPFPSVRSLLAIRRSVPAFRRKRYPRSLKGRTIRDPLIDKLMWIPWTMAWWMFSPVAIFFQMLPERESETRIKVPESGAAGDTLAARA